MHTENGPLKRVITQKSDHSIQYYDFGNYVNLYS